jgi:hypothetical protein
LREPAGLADDLPPSFVKTDGFVEYVLRDLKESAASPKGRRMISFHEWRRDEDDDYRASLKSGERPPLDAS